MTTRFEAAVDNAGMIRLADIGERAGLLSRYDRKYAVSMGGVTQFVEEIGSSWLVVEVNGERSPLYRTTYFDDSRRTSFHEHVKRCRHRYKVRVRTYSTGTSFLEFKTKDGRGQTEKIRIERTSDSTTLDSVELDWLSARLPRVDVSDLRPELLVEYRRVTLLGPNGDERLTIDHALRVGREEAEFSLLEAGALVETKSIGPRSSAAHTLRQSGARSVSFSKYCAGVSLVDTSIHPRLRTGAERAVARN